MSTIITLFITIPILIYWFKVGMKFSKTDTINTYFIHVVLAIISIALIWWALFPEMGENSPPIYFIPKGFLICILTVILAVVWPIVLDVWFDKQQKQ